MSKPIRGNTVGTTMKRPDFNRAGSILNNPIPPVTAEDNGKFLRVVDGKWAKADVATYKGETEDEE